jgi:dienelactone hydrolase
MLAWHDENKEIPYMLRIWLAAAFVLISITGCPTPFVLGFPGEYPVARYFVDDINGVQPVTIYYPDTETPLRNLPVVILNTGWNQPRLSYDGYGRQLAQWGYVCVVKFVASAGLVGIGDAAVDDHALQNSILLDWLEAENAHPASVLYQMADTANAAVAGHSLGAGVAITAATRELRFKAVVSLDGNYASADFDPRPDLPNSDAAYLFFFATEGGRCSAEDIELPRLFELTKNPSIEVSIIGADHIDYMDSVIGLTHAAPRACPPGSQEAQVVRDICARYMIAWLNVHLKGMTEFAEYYDGGPSDADTEAGLVTIRSKLE